MCQKSKGKEENNTSYENLLSVPHVASKPLTVRGEWPKNRRRPSRRYMVTRSPARGCEHCGSTDLVRDDVHADMVCIQCATCHDDALTDDAYKCLGYDDFAKLRSYSDSLRRRNGYKKCSYFNETLKNLSAGVVDGLPQHVWEIIRFQDYMTVPVTAAQIRPVLKRHALHKYYGQACVLASMVNRAEGNACPSPLRHDEEDSLRFLFAKFSKVFDRIRGDRKNSLNYAYVTYQLLRLIGRDDLCDRVTVLKCKSRLRQHDLLWKTICEVTRWPYSAYLI